MIEFASRFPDDINFDLMPYYFSIKVLLKLRPVNYDPWSYVLSIGQGYLSNHVVSNNLTIVIFFLSEYRVL